MDTGLWKILSTCWSCPTTQQAQEELDLMRLLKLIDIIHLVEHTKVDSSLWEEVSGLS